MSTPARLGTLALATGLVALSAGPALAAAPERTAWFSALTVAGTALPAPTVAEGDLRVAGTGAQPTAYATLLLTAPGTAGGELVLAVRPGSVVGTPELAACPTKSSTWKEGGNQPFEDGPGYDCDAGSVFGSLAADGASIAFPLDSSVRSADGTLSVALAPLPASTSAFSLDLGDPAFTPDASTAPGSAPAPAPAEPSAQEPPPAAPPPLSSGSAPTAPQATTADAPPPLLAGADEPLPSAPAAAPALPDTPPAAVAAPTAVLPTARLAASEQDRRDGPRVLALLTLVAVSAGAGYAAGQQRPAPRLIGGRAAAGTSTAVAVTGPDRDPAPRGIGRFSRVRDVAPRRLR